MGLQILVTVFMLIVILHTIPKFFIRVFMGTKEERQMHKVVNERVQKSLDLDDTKVATVTYSIIRIGGLFGSNAVKSSIVTNTGELFSDTLSSPRDSDSQYQVLQLLLDKKYKVIQKYCG